MSHELRPLAPEDDVEPQRQGLQLRHIAVLGFLVGVLLHACVIMSLTGGGGTGGSPRAGPSPAAPAAALATPTRAPDRTNCDEIRGTDYRSEAERQWFMTNCR